MTQDIARVLGVRKPAGAKKKKVKEQVQVVSKLTSEQEKLFQKSTREFIESGKERDFPFGPPCLDNEG
jgi:hypothetical protein